MAEVSIIPKIRCDNCGLVEDKEPAGKEYRKPRRWGSATLFSGRGMNGYPPEELRFIDLCEECAITAHDTAAMALKYRRGVRQPKGAEGGGPADNWTRNKDGAIIGGPGGGGYYD